MTKILQFRENPALFLHLIGRVVMKLTMIAAAAGLIAAPAVAGTVGTPALSAGNETGIETVAVAFDALKSGENDRAIRQILAEESADPGDPARMINLGTAYARIGRTKEAAALFRAVMRSEERYALELADGQWIDSKEAAQRALARLTASEATRVAAK
jgi:hypothetical protein